MEKLIKQAVLHNTTGNHNKYYEVSIYQTSAEKGKEQFKVIARWGRIEHFQSGNPQSQVKAYGGFLLNTEPIYNNLIAEKKKHGYVEFTQTATEKYKLKPSKEKVHQQPDRTEVTLPNVGWWDSGFENIEERAI